MDNGNKSALQNPVLIVFLGDWKEAAAERMKRRFDFPESVVCVYVHNSDMESFQDGKVIDVCYGTDLEWISKEEKKNRITTSLYLTKRRRYPQFNSVDICILKKGEDSNSVLLQTVDLIIECTQAPFLGNIFLDLYCWVDERSVQAHGNRLFESERKLLASRDSVRFLFILSQMDNEDVLMEAEESVLDLIMDSMMLLNFNHFPIYKQLNLKAAASGSRSFKLGSRKLALDEMQMKSLFRYRLLKSIREWKRGGRRQNEKVDLGLRELESVIQNQLSALYDGLGGICSYEKKPHVSAQTEAAALGYCFGNNHERYMDLNKGRYMDNIMQFTKQFCRAQLFGYLNTMFQASGGNFLLEEDIQTVKRKALDQCGEVSVFEIHSDGTDSQLLNGVPRLLEQWARKEILELMNEAYERCVREVRGGICMWSQRLNAGREEFEAAYWSAQHDCSGIDDGRNRIEGKMVGCTIEVIDQYLKNHEAMICRNGYENIWRMVTVGKLEQGSVAKVVEEHTEMAFLEFLKDFSSFDHISLAAGGIQERQSFYDTVYEEILEEGKFQIRGHIPNEEVYCCYVGNLKKEFAEYIDQKYRDMVYCTDRISEPLVIYYQNVQDFQQLFAFRN